MTTANLLLIVCALQLSAQSDQGLIGAKTRDQVITSTVDALNRSYVYPEVAKKMADSVRARQATGEYNAIASNSDFAWKLSEDLRAVSHDKHLHVGYSFEPIPEGDAPRMRGQDGSGNSGFETVQRLPGNLGYLDLRFFDGSEFARQKAAAVMNSLADSDALIIDLRHNGGGRSAIVELLSSYVFGASPVHLYDMYDRPTDSMHQVWTLADLPGRRSPDTDVYILTSPRTFSAGEAFAYNLQCLKRAIIVGEVTGGGAHPGEEQRIDEHFTIFIPSGRVINPITKTDWESVGVKPDIAAPEEKALKMAQRMALKKIAGKTADPMFKLRLAHMIFDLEKDLR
jgi:hypothetical protein